MLTSNLFNYRRRISHEIKIGSVLLGGKNPIRVQSMTNTNTNDIEESVAQTIRIINAGGDIVRLTTQGIREAESIGKVHESLRAKGYHVPLVADIHFNANAADIAATKVEKVRINPGNYVGSIKIGDNSDYTDEEFQLEYQKIQERFIPFLEICKTHHTSIRLGVNHGSLSERIMNRYGDTSRGMVESCMEFLRICRQQNFDRVVISMKTSNTVMMIHTVRLLVQTMEAEDLSFPIHLGVTEAGDGEDGRIKSAVGIGGLLAEGIGDTLRVSLSEDPEYEIPVGRQLVAYIGEREGHSPIIARSGETLKSRFEYSKRETNQVGTIGGNNVPVVFTSKNGEFPLTPDYLLKDGKVYNYNTSTNYNIYTVSQIDKLKQDTNSIQFLELRYADLNETIADVLQSTPSLVVLLRTDHQNGLGEQRAFFYALTERNIKTPVIICRSYKESKLDALQIKSGADIGVLFIDGFGDGIFIENEGSIEVEKINSVSFGILQASRVRVSKTEFISCPSCGRTMFNLQSVIARVKSQTSHLKGLKIGIMGCIVNGPGEMADADYGYVGAGRGKVSLYKRKECMEKNIPEEMAVDKLVELIKAHGDWKEE